MPGKEHSKAKPEQVAEATVHLLSMTVLPMVPTIVFLSGGFSDTDSIEYLNAINKHKKGGTVGPDVLVRKGVARCRNASLVRW